MRSMGVDSGTLSVDIVVIEDEPLRVVHEEAVPRQRMVADPEWFVRHLEEIAERLGVESMAMSSGYGVALKRARDAEPWEIEVATFIHREDEKRGLRILGLRRVMQLLRESRLQAWFTPGVVQLDTVPRYRKLNRIDMGTSDKVYSVAAAVWAEVEQRGVSPREVNIIVLEVGYAYTAAIAVKDGAIVDGVGGTTAFTGYMGAGAWDAELAYLAAFLEPGFSKNRLFEGGAASLLGKGWPPPRPEEVAEAASRGDKAARETLDALTEAAAKTALSLLAVVRPRRVYVTGRWARIPLFMERLAEKLEPMLQLGAEATRLTVTHTAKEAAFGAALIANGLAGGRYAWLPESLGLTASRGTVFDHIAVGGYREKALSYYRGREV